MGKAREKWELEEEQELDWECSWKLKQTILLHDTKKINLKWIKDLNIRPETIKLLEENMCSKFLDISLGKDFLDLIPKSKDNKIKINKWKCNYITKKTINKMKGNLQNRTNYLQIAYIISNEHPKTHTTQ